MKSSTTRWMIAAAALAVAAGSASAQTYKANIPMAFRAGNTVLAPGSYLIRSVKNATPTFSVFNLETRRSVLLVANANADAPKGWREGGDPKLSFICGGEACTLQTLWSGSDPFSYRFATRPLPVIEASRVKTVTLAAARVR
ncbi:MAG TPA: hypothetical protein VKU19_42895 [Bryobacteraceae bacterium]|nr:hypothetical protein [Bryobacteraceae bacterium]